jgi:hypothetical protein
MQNLLLDLFVYHGQNKWNCVKYLDCDSVYAFELLNQGVPN